MTSLRNLPAIQRRMHGHVKSRSLIKWMELTTTLLSLMLLSAADSTAAAAAATTATARVQHCRASLQQTSRLTRLALRESADLIKTYKASQGEMSEVICTASVNYDIPDPNISGLEPSDQIASVYTRLQGFLAHLRRVQEQQSDLQLPGSPLLAGLSDAGDRSRHLAVSVSGFYRELFPNLPMPEAGPTALPPPMNVFQQKVYGCQVLRTYKDFLSNVMRELKPLKSVCKGRA